MTPSSGMAREVALGIQGVVLDVDGVLTDAGVYVGMGPGGLALELKRFDIQDGLGIRMLQEAGIQVAVVSGRVSESTTLRMAELGVEECHQDSGAQKLPVVEEIRRRWGLRWSQMAMMGDDLPDLPVLTRVGLPVAVANAVPEVKSRCSWTTSLSGGKGAVREFARALLSARGEWELAVDRYVEARGGLGVGS